MDGQRWTSLCPDQSVASDFGTHQAHAIKDKVVLSVRFGVSGCYVTWMHQLIPPDMMMIGGSIVLCHLDSLTVTLDLMSDRYIWY